MAIRDDFFTALTKGARWDVGVSIKRSNPLPLDDKSVFQTYEALEAYAADVLAYPGQVVAVVGETSTTIYYLDQNLAIQPVGIIPTGDDKTVEVTEEGAISLKGAAQAQAGQQPRIVNKGTAEAPKLELEWFTPDTSTVAGLSTAVGALNKTVDGVVAEDGTVTEKGLTHKVADLEGKVGTPVDGETAATGLYKEIADERARATKAEEDLQKAIDAIDFIDETELADAIKDFTTKKYVDDADALKADITYVDGEIDKVEKSISDLADEVAAIEIPVVGAADGEKIISVTDKKLVTTLSIAKTKKEDGKTYVQLIGKDGAVVSEFDAAEFVADGMLESVTKNEETNEIIFTWNTSAGVTETKIDIDDLVEVYTAGNGVDITNFVVSVKKDATSEDFLSVGVDGIKLSGVQAAIDTAKGEVEEALSGAVEAIVNQLASAEASISAHDAILYGENGLDERVIALEAVDNVTKDELTTYKGEVTTAIGTAKQEVIDDTATKLAAKADATSVYTKTEIDGFDYANKTYVGTAVAGEAEIARAAEKKNADAIKVIADDYLKSSDKTTIDAAIALKADKTALETEVNTLKTGVIATAQATADKGVADAAAAQSTANDAHAATVAHSGKISALEKTVNGWTPAEGEQGEAVFGLTNTVGNHENRLGTLEGTVAGHTTTINNINNTLAEKAEKIDLTATNGRVSDLESKVGAPKHTDTDNNEVAATGLFKTVSDIDARLTAEETYTTYKYVIAAHDDGSGASLNLAVTEIENSGKPTEKQTTTIVDTGAKSYITERLSALETTLKQDSQDKVDALDSSLRNEIYGYIAGVEGLVDELRNEETGRVTIAEKEIDALQETVKGLSGAMHFKGVVTSDPTAKGFDVSGYATGDVVIFGNKEYVFSETSFVEFGDATGNASAITALDTRVKTLEDVDHAAAHAATLKSATDYADGLATNYATAVQGAKADTAIQSVTTTAGNGLKVTASAEDPTALSIDFDDEVVFVFGGGSATSEW
jgi:uncharacterized coiled-coil protein SlyX